MIKNKNTIIVSWYQMEPISKGIYSPNFTIIFVIFLFVICYLLFTEGITAHFKRGITEAFLFGFLVNLVMTVGHVALIDLVSAGLAFSIVKGIILGLEKLPIPNIIID